MRHLVPGPAVDRLEWILDGLSGDASWGGDAGEVLAPGFAAIVPPDRFAAMVRQRATALAPAAVIGVDVGDHTARARVRAGDGGVHVVKCAVEDQAPHRIASAAIMALVPPFTAPRLPGDFSGSPLLDGQGADARLIVFSGVPGTGKSTLADATGRELRVPVFAVDWLLGSLTPFGGYHLDRMLDIGTELIVTLTFRQLWLGQSAVVDYPAEEPAFRARLESLARAAGAEFKVVVCTCSDPGVHQARVEGRTRGIPGWHEGGNWANVQRRLAAFPPWAGEVLTVDAVRPVTENLASVLKYVAG